MANEPADAVIEILKGIQASISRLEGRMEKAEVRQVESLQILEELARAGTDMADICRNMGGRLNIIDGRLARLEKTVGLVDA